MRFAPVAVHATAPLLRMFTVTLYEPPAIIAGSAGGVTAATYAASAFTGCGPLGGNQATPSFTSAKRSVYAPGVSGAVIPAFTVRAPFAGTSAPRAVRAPSQTTALPLASYQWYERFTGFAPVAFQIWLLVFVTVTGTTRLPPAATDGAAADAVYVALTVGDATVTVNGALCGNQATPSFTRAKLRRYRPGPAGACTFACRVICVPEPTGTTIGVRAPSHTTAEPAAS